MYNTLYTLSKLFTCYDLKIKKYVHCSRFIDKTSPILILILLKDSKIYNLEQIIINNRNKFHVSKKKNIYFPYV